MKTLVKEVMIPVDEFPSVSEDASLYEAFLELEKAHDALEGKNYRPRAVLVLDRAGKAAGKLNLWDSLRALEPKYAEMADFDRLTHFGINAEFMRSMVEKHDLWTDNLETLCRAAAKQRVGDLMSTPSRDEYIDDEASLAEAVHQIIMGRHLSLLATRDGEVTGFLRICDVFQLVCETMRTL